MNIGDGLSAIYEFWRPIVGDDHAATATLLSVSALFGTVGGILLNWADTQVRDLVRWENEQRTLKDRENERAAGRERSFPSPRP